MEGGFSIGTRSRLVLTVNGGRNFELGHVLAVNGG